MLSTVFFLRILTDINNVVCNNYKVVKNMLIQFWVKNFKNFKDKLTFNFENTNNYEFSKECIKNDIIKTALIYGTNGCGKSNLAFAIFDIISHLTDMEITPDKYMNYINANTDRNSIAEFGYIFKFENTILRYSYGKTELRKLIFEKLEINNKVLVEYDRRNRNERYFKTNLAGSETLNTDLSQFTISVLKYIKTSTVLKDNEEKKVLFKFFNFVDSMLHFRSLDDRFYQGYETGRVDIFDYIADKHLDDFNSFLHQAKLDINSVTAEKINGHKQLFMEFDNGKIGFYSNASTGTMTLALFYFWLKRMEEHKPSLVFIDEFDAFYHQELSEFIVRQLQKLDCQVILTTHNTRLLSNDLMRPDCCFILKNGILAPLSSLTDKELREAHNIEKMYRAKVFDK